MRQKNILSLILLAILISSCGQDFLEPEPTSAIDVEDFYQNDQELQMAVLNMYDGIQGFNSYIDSDPDLNHSIQIEYYITEMRSDNTQSKNSEGEAAQFDTYNITPNNGAVSDYYTSFYNVVYRANTVIANIGAATEANAPLYEAEAKFIRAYAYFNLVRLYGDIPLIDRVVGLTEREVQFTRVPTSQIYDLIIDDLINAIDNLDNTYKNRASKAAAQTLLAKVYLTLGINYLDAQQLCEEVMQSGFSLEDNFKDVFYNENNNEIIFAIGFIPDNSNDSQNFSAEWLNAVGRTSGVNYVTSDVIQALNDYGGNRTEYSYRQDAIEPDKNQVVKYLPNGDDDLDIAPTSNDAQTAGNDWIVIRYADVLLLHVEAIMAGGLETSSPNAIASFQEVRDRAGLTDPVTLITKEDLLNERRVELAFENHRLFDLIRFNVAQEVLSEYSAENDYNFTSTDLLLPMPQREVNLSNGIMTQNPGY